MQQSEVKFIQFDVKMNPTPWKRPAGTTQRFDAQVNDKAAFALRALAELRANGWLPKPGLPIFPKGVPVKVHAQFFYQQKNITAGPMSKDLFKHDVDNLCKFVLDACQSQALEKVIWDDDSQVLVLHAEKLVTSSSSFISCTISQLSL